MTKGLNKYGMTPGRAAIMAVLAIALGAVWGPQLLALWSGPAPVATTTPTKPRAPVGAKATPTPPKPQSANASKPAAERPLPKMTAAEAGAYDPFAVPAWSPASLQLADGASGGKGNDIASRFEALRSKGVAMILVSEEGNAAQLGDQTLRVGDHVDGFEVIEITPTGVVFKPATPSKQPEAARGA